MKKNIRTFQKMKLDRQPMAWVTAYDYPLSKCAQNAGVDMILVGDSGGMVQLGYETTNPVTMDEMVLLSQCVRRGAPDTFIVGDMPQGSYEVSNESAVRNALRFVKESGCDCIKLEGGKRVCDRVHAIVGAGIPVIGHLGLTPQSTVTFGGYRVQCKTVQSFEETLKDAYALQDAGAWAILLEALPDEPAGQISKSLRIPIYGIGAGRSVDGQLIIMHDLLGLYDKFRPHFTRCYIPSAAEAWAAGLPEQLSLKEWGTKTRKDGLAAIAELAIAEYVSDVRNRVFPQPDCIYPIKEDELMLLKQSPFWQPNGV